MTEKTPSPGGAGTAANDSSAGDPAASRPGGPIAADRESIVVPPAILAQQAGWAQPGEKPRPAGGTRTDTEDAPQIFASSVRKAEASEAGYDENPPGVGKLGVILGTVLALLLVGSGITLYMVNKDNSKDTSAAAQPDATKSAPPTPSAEPVPPIKDSAKVLPTVTGDFGKKADIQVPGDKSDGSFVVKVLSEGSGPKVDKNNWTSVDYTATVFIQLFFNIKNKKKFG